MGACSNYMQPLGVHKICYGKTILTPVHYNFLSKLSLMISCKEYEGLRMENILRHI